MVFKRSSKPCKIHDDVPSVEKCQGCASPICEQCVQQWGPFCGPTCKNKVAMNKKMSSKEAEERKKRKWSSFHFLRLFMYIIMRVLTLALLGFIGWKVYMYFFEPSGTIVWEWQPKEAYNSIQILGGENNKGRVSDGTYIYTLDATTGQITAQEKFSASTEGQQYGNWLIEFDEDYMHYSNIKKETVKKAKFKYRPFNDEMFLGPKGDNIYFVTNNSKEVYAALKEKKKIKLEWRWVRFDLSRRKLFSRELDCTQARIIGVIGSMPIFMLRTLTDDDKKALADPKKKNDPMRAWDMGQWRLFGVPGKGKKEKSVKLPAEPTWGPEIHGNWIYTVIDSKFYGVDFGGKSKAFTIKLTKTEDGWVDSVYINKEDAMISYGGRIDVIDLKEKKVAWKAPLNLSTTPAFYQNRIISFFEVTESIDPNEEDMIKIKDEHKDLLSEFDFENPTERISTILMCIDRKSGEVIWKNSQAVGELYTDGKKIVVITDTSQTSKVAMLNKNFEGKFYIKQYDPDTGKKMYAKKHEKINFSNFIIAGDFMLSTVTRPGQDKPKVAGVKLR